MCGKRAPLGRRLTPGGCMEYQSTVCEGQHGQRKPRATARNSTSLLTLWYRRWDFQPRRARDCKTSLVRWSARSNRLRSCGAVWPVCLLWVEPRSLERRSPMMSRIRHQQHNPPPLRNISFLGSSYSPYDTDRVCATYDPSREDPRGALHLYTMLFPYSR